MVLSRIRRARYSGSCFVPRLPVASCWRRWRHWVSLSPASLTTWNGSRTSLAWGTAFLTACLYPANASIATTRTFLLNSSEREASHPANAAPLLPSTTSRRRADRPFWAQAAKASREYLVTACHPQTGMNPEYSNYDGTPHVDERDHWHFYSDAYRTAGNIGLDCLWNGVVPDLCDANARLQRFFLEHDRTCVYAIDGTPVDETVLHPVGFIATTAEGSLAAMHSQEPDALDNAIRWVRLLWDTPIRTGTRRYYDNFLYAFAFLALAGEYRVW